ncbi:34522_t:CDS:2, partial [Racocetra persica]
HKEAIFVFAEEPMIDEKVIDEGCVTKRNINQRESKLVDVRCIKGELMENDRNRSKFGVRRELMVKKLVNDDNNCISGMYNLGCCYRIGKDVSRSTNIGCVDEINEVNGYCGNGSN